MLPKQKAVTQSSRTTAHDAPRRHQFHWAHEPSPSGEPLALPDERGCTRFPWTAISNGYRWTATLVTVLPDASLVRTSCEWIRVNGEALIGVEWSGICGEGTGWYEIGFQDRRICSLGAIWYCLDSCTTVLAHQIP
jgi:hypothetical protein